METHLPSARILLVLCAVFNLALGLFHLCFWRLFRWKQELPRLSFLNRQIMQVLNLCLTFLFFVMAWVSAFHGPEMTTTALGRTLLLAFALFWFLRAIEQPLFFGVERSSVLFTAAFGLGALLHLAALLTAVR